MKSPSKEQGYSQKTQINKDRSSQIAASQHARNSSRSASTSFAGIARIAAVRRVLRLDGRTRYQSHNNIEIGSSVAHSLLESSVL